MAKVAAEAAKVTAVSQELQTRHRRHWPLEICVWCLALAIGLVCGMWWEGARTNEVLRGMLVQLERIPTPVAAAPIQPPVRRKQH